MSEPTLALTPDPPERAAPADRRDGTRYHYRLARCLTRPRFRQGWAKVRGVSADGVTLVLGHDSEPGAVLRLQLRRGPEGKTHTRLARVLWAELRPSGNYLVACQFTPPLSGEELAAILG